MIWERIVEFPPYSSEHQIARFLWMLREQKQFYEKTLGNKDIFRNS